METVVAQFADTLAEAGVRRIYGIVPACCTEVICSAAG